MKVWVSAAVLSTFLAACGGGGGGAPSDTELSAEEVRSLSAGVWIGETRIQEVAGASYPTVALSYEDQFFSVLDLGGALGELFYDSTVEVINQREQDGKVIWDTFSIAALFQAGRRQTPETETTATAVLRQRVDGTFESQDVVAGGLSGEIELEFSADPLLTGTLEEVSGTWGSDDTAIMVVDAGGVFVGTDDEVVGFGSACTLSGTLTEIDVDISLFEVNITLTACVQSDRNGSYSGLASVIPLGESDERYLYLMAANGERAYFGAFGSNVE